MHARLLRYAVVTALALAGCGSRASVHVVHLASADARGIEHDPAVAFFVRRVAQLSGGRLRVDVDEQPWTRGRTASESQLLRDVVHGDAELGWAHARSFEALGVQSFAALDAPMLIDGYRAQSAVVRSPVTARMLDGVCTTRLRPLALLAGPLSRLVGTAGPLRSLGSLHRLTIGVHQGRIVHERASHDAISLAVQALHAFPQPMYYDFVDTLYVRGPGDAQVKAALEDDLDSLFFDRYAGACVPGEDGCGARGPWVTANLVLWPRPAVLVANAPRLDALPARERRWIQTAAVDAAAYSARIGHGAEQRLVPELCTAGIRFTNAPPAAVASLRHALRPVYARLERSRETRVAIRRIERLRRGSKPDPPLAVPASCTRPARAQRAARGVASSLPGGVYRVRITAADLRAAGATLGGNRPGTATLTLRGGRWRLVLTEPGRVVRTGTYAGTPLRTTWAYDGTQRNESYLSIVVGKDLGLRFHVLRAGDLPYARAVYASHVWVRIGS